MTSHNDITGDKIVSKLGNQKAYDEGHERIFGKKKLEPDKESECLSWLKDEGDNDGEDSR